MITTLVRFSILQTKLFQPKLVNDLIRNEQKIFVFFDQQYKTNYEERFRCAGFEKKWKTN